MKFFLKLLVSLAMSLSFASNVSAQSLPFNAYSVSTLGGNCAQQGSVMIQSASGMSKCLGAGTNGQVLQSKGPSADPAWLTTSGTGTVTSVGATVPSYMSVSGSPVTAAGSLGLSFNSQTANQFFASPNGTSGVPTFRSLTTADLPALPAPTASVLGGAFSSTAGANQFATGLSLAGALTYAQPSFANLSGTISTSQFASQSAKFALIAPNGASGVPTFRQILASDTSFTASGTGGAAIDQGTINNRVVNIDNYGATHNGTTDDTTPLTNAMTSLGTMGGTVYLSCAFNYALNTNFTVPANIRIQHCNGKQGNPGVDWATGPIASQPHINMPSTATMTFSSNSGFSGIIINSAITPPVQTAASFGGTAMKLGSGGINDVKINALVVGFNICMDGTNGGDRQNWTIDCDGNNASGGSVIIGPSFDTSYFTIRTYPWATVAYPTSPTLTRSGTGTQILSGTSDDDHINVFDFGHSTGINVQANGNIHFSHIWTDNNATSGIDWNGCDRCTVDAAYVYTTPVGFRALANGTYNINYMLCDLGAAASGNCFATAAGVSPRIHIGNYDVKSATQSALNIGSTGAKVVIDNASIVGVNSSTGPYILGVASWTSNQVKIGAFSTDLPAGQSLFGGNVQSLPAVASAATLLIPAEYDHFTVTGTTTITNIAGTWNDRRIILTTSGSLTLTNNANINLIGGTNFTMGAGSSVALWYDQPNAIWRAEWQH